MSTHPYDVAVIGAGTAGLQAALTLGRMRQSVVVLGTDRHRNDPAAHMQNFLGHDGEHPGELRAAARKDAERYETVTFLDREVSAVEGDLGDFTLILDDGERLRAGRVLLATGVVDDLPAIPGLEALFGDLVAHCPFCHGHEFADTPVGVLGSAAHVSMMAAMLGPIASDVVVLTDGADLDDGTAASLASLGVPVRKEAVTAVARAGAGLRIELAGGDAIELGGLFVKTDWRLGTPFAEQLGLELSAMGAVIVDAFGRTSRAGVYAAGDMAQGPGLPMPMASVLTAASAGLLAAAGCVQDAAIARSSQG